MGPVHGNGEYVAELMQELMKLRLPSHRRLLNRLSLLQYGSPQFLSRRGDGLLIVQHTPMRT